MSLLIAYFVAIFVVAPTLVYLMGRKEDKKQINENKRSSILFNSTVIERTATPEEVFRTLDKAGIKPAFLQNESN